MPNARLYEVGAAASYSMLLLVELEYALIDSADSAECCRSIEHPLG